MSDNQNAAERTEDPTEIGGKIPSQLVHDAQIDIVKSSTADKDQGVREEIVESYQNLVLASQNSEDIEKEVDETFNIAKALESLAQVVEKQYGNNFNRQFHTVATIGLESLSERLGLDTREDRIALEERIDDDVEYIKLFARSAFRTVKRIWEILIESLKRLYKFAKELLRQVFAESARLKRNAASLITKAKAVRGTIQQEVLVIPNIGKYVSRSTGVSGDLLADVTELRYISDGVYREMVRWSSRIGEDIADYLNKTNLTDEELPPVIPMVKIPYGNNREVLIPENEGFSQVKDTKLYATGELLGGVIIYTRIPENNLYMTDLERVTNVYANIGTYYIDRTTSQAGNDTVPTLDRGQCARICEVIFDTLTNIDNYKSTASINARIEDDIVSGIERLNRELPNVIEGEHKRSIEFIKRCAVASPRIVEEPARGFSLYYLNMARALLSYVNQSLNTYHET